MHTITVRFLKCLMLMICLLTMHACGQKGDLYLPDQAGVVHESLRLHS
ncbi:MAG: lipoprotein [Thiotrichales bacterium]|nr:lipoprotein [Thiotrichales bacterium]